jgi:hypothetical protein
LATNPSDDAAAWWAQIEPELAGANAAWGSGNAGKGRVGARRAAGMGLKAWLSLAPKETYGTSFMHHLNALADDAAQPQAIRESAWRLAARAIPEGGFQVPLAPGLTPMADARAIIAAGQAAAREEAGSLGSLLPPKMSPPPSGVLPALEAFTSDAIGRMVPLCAILRRVSPGLRTAYASP